MPPIKAGKNNKKAVATQARARSGPVKRKAVALPAEKDSDDDSDEEQEFEDVKGLKAAQVEEGASSNESSDSGDSDTGDDASEAIENGRGSDVEDDEESEESEDEAGNEEESSDSEDDEEQQAATSSKPVKAKGASKNGRSAATQAADRSQAASKSSKKPSSAASASSSSSASSKKTAPTFADLGLDEVLCKACENMKFKEPTEIQREAIPHALQGRDIIGLAETGSGKTAAFALPVLHALLITPGHRGVFGVVMAPTRELAFQIRDTFNALGASIGLKTAVLVGGIDMMAQAVALSKRPHVIIATPGRIVDHLQNTKGFHLKNLKYLIMDEADRCLNLDFEKEIDQLLKVIPRERTTFLFSATMTSKVAKLQRASLRDPVKVEVSSKYKTADGLIQRYIFIPHKYKDCYLAYILQELQGNSFMIFTNTCSNAMRSALMLRDLGFDAICLHGQMTQPKRLGALAKFQAQKNSILIATDVASRGLDIPHVDIVVNFDIPTHSKDYIHRVGRTARAGRSGRAITFVTQYDVELFQRIEQLVGLRMDKHPTEESEVLQFLSRVTEAQRMAIQELKMIEQRKKELKRTGMPRVKRSKSRR